MNTENIQALITHLENLPHPQNFTMNHWIGRDPDCGTSACIAGYAAIIARPAFNMSKSYDRAALASDAAGVAQEWLGLGTELSDLLFTPNHFMKMALSLVTVEQAIGALKLLLLPKFRFSKLEDYWFEIAEAQNFDDLKEDEDDVVA